MRNVLVAALGAMLFVGFGCQNDGGGGQSTRRSGTQSTADACTHCSGMQTGTSDGKCEMCGGKATVSR